MFRGKPPPSTLPDPLPTAALLPSTPQSLPWTRSTQPSAVLQRALLLLLFITVCSLKINVSFFCSPRPFQCSQHEMWWSGAPYARRDEGACACPPVHQEVPDASSAYPFVLQVFSFSQLLFTSSKKQQRKQRLTRKRRKRARNLQPKQRPPSRARAASARAAAMAMVRGTE